MNTDNQDATPEEVGTIKPSGKPSSTLKKLALWLLFSLAIIIIIVSVILAWGLGTQAGREWAANTVITIANTSENLNVKAINIESPSLGLWTIDSIELYLADKKTFTAQKFEFRWFPKELFDQKIHIEAVLAEKMDVYLYEGKEKPKREEESQPFTIPSLPYIEFENFNFPSINIHKEQISNESLSTDTTQKSSQDALIQSLEKITLNGNFLLPENQLLQLNVNAESSAKNPLKINIKSTVRNNEKQQPQVDIVGSLSEGAGGNLSSLIKIADNKSLYAQINAGIDATITPQGPNILIDLKDLHLDIKTPRQSKKTHKIQLATLAEINTKNLTTVVNTFTLNIDNTKHTGYGSWDGSQAQASLTLNKLPLEMISIWFKPIDSGAVTGDFLAKGTVTEGQLKSLQWSVNSELNTRYQKVPVFTKIIAQGNQDIFNINTLSIKSDNTKVSASGAVDIKGNTNAIVFSIEKLGTDLIKNLELPLPPSVPLDKADLTINKASGKVSGKLLDPNVDATIHIKGKYEGQPIEGESIIKKKGDAITIEKLWLTSNDAKSSASGNLDLKSLSADLNLTINEFPINLLALAGVSLPKNLSAKISSDVVFNGYLTPQKIIHADIKGKVSANGTLDNIPFSVDANGSQSQKLAKLDNLNVTTFDQNVLDVSGEFANDMFDVSFIADKVPLKLLEALNMPPINGEFTANIKAQGNINTLKETSNISGILSYTTEFTGIDENDEEKAFKYNWTSNIETLNESQKAFPNSSKQLNIASTITRDNKNSGDINITVPLDTYLGYMIEKKKELT